MNIHEHQAKQILKKYGAVVPEGIFALTVKDLVEKVGMKILMGPHATYVDTPGNKGVTAIVGIETSHIAFHIWDEEMPARLQFDLYTCGPLDKEIVINKVKERFAVVSADYRIFDRETGFVLLEEGTF